MILSLADEAADDIAEIARYTRKRWGADKARSYSDGLVQMLRVIADNPGRGRRDDRLPEKFYKARYRQHHIYYVIDADAVVIARIIHQRRDATRHVR